MEESDNIPGDSKAGCRLCFSKDKLCNIFVLRNKKYNLTCADLVKDCLSMDVSSTDGLPAWVCLRCSTKLNTFYTYKVKCYQNIEKLQTRIGIIDSEPLIKIENLENNQNSIIIENIEDFEVLEDDKEFDPEDSFIHEEMEIKIKTEVKPNKNEDIDNATEIIIKDLLRPKSEVKPDILKEEPPDAVVELDVLLTQIEHSKLKICPLCKRKFTRPIFLGDHVKFVHYGIQYYCDICDKYVNQETRHKKLHLQRKWEQCDDCGETFGRQMMYIDHIIKVHDKGGHECDCGQSFKDPETLKEHKLSEHKKNYACNFCPRVYTRKDKLKYHLQCHIQNKVMRPFVKETVKTLPIDKIPLLKADDRVCPICGERKVNHDGLIEHIKSAHLGEKYFCEICKKHVTDKIRHKTRYHYVAEWKKCKDCGQHFKRLKDFQDHMKRVHQTDFQNRRYKYTCHCGIVFHGIAKLRYHKYKIHKETDFICQYCSKGFLKKEKLMDHIRDVHIKSLLYTCQTCNKVYNNRDSYRQHLYVHKNEVYICDHCNKQFNTKDLIRAHITRHDPAQKKHACAVCGKCFRRTDHRNNHQKLVHKLT